MGFRLGCVGDEVASDGVRIRTAEAVAVACLATDLGMGFPFEHGLHTTLTAMRLADQLGVGRQVASQTYYVCLLTYAGCTTDASESARIFGKSLTVNVAPVEHGSSTERLAGVIRALAPAGTSRLRRAYEVLRRLPSAARFSGPHYAALCEVASMLAARLGLPPEVSELFAYMTERWDGDGVLGRAAGEDIPLPIRIVHVARDATYQRVLGGDEHAASVIRDRAGHAFDPEIANLCADRAGTVMGDAETPGSVWDAVLAAEPRPWPALPPAEVDRALAAMGDFADLVSPWLSGHSQAVADLADKAARTAGFDDADVRRVRRASHIHDLGRVAVHPGVWGKPGPLTADEWEQVRLHPYHTERVLAACPRLAHLGAVAGAHHERLDGSGYHRGVSGGLARSGCPADRGCGRVLCHDRTQSAPATNVRRTGCRHPCRRSRGWQARSRPGSRGDRSRRTVGPTDRASVRADNPRSRGGRSARPWPADQTGSRRARHLGKDGRQPHPERLPQDGGVLPGGGDPLRDGARPRALG